MIDQNAIAATRAEAIEALRNYTAYDVNDPAPCTRYHEAMGVAIAAHGYNPYDMSAKATKARFRIMNDIYAAAGRGRPFA